MDIGITVIVMPKKVIVLVTVVMSVQIVPNSVNTELFIPDDVRAISVGQVKIVQLKK